MVFSNATAINDRLGSYFLRALDTGRSTNQTTIFVKADSERCSLVNMATTGLHLGSVYIIDYHLHIFGFCALVGLF